jgi:CRP-like cAMP-binding protein
MYIVLSGSLMVSAPTAGRDDLPLGRVTANEVIGEMGLLEGAPRAATARCEQEALLLAVDRPTWDGLIARDDVLAHWLLERCAEGLARRIQAMMDRIAAAAHDPDSLHSLPAAAPRREIGWLAWILGGARR